MLVQGITTDQESQQSYIYAADLENNALIGQNAAAKITVSAAGTITDVDLIDGGCGYGIGNTMTVSSFPSGAPSVAGVVSVTSNIQ